MFINRFTSTIGSQTEIAGMLREFAIETNGINSKSRSLVWGTENLKMPSPMAAYLNGCSNGAKIPEFLL
jgi:hypothetical protein